MRGSPRRAFRPPWRGCTIIVTVCAPIATLVCWYFGTDVWHAVAVSAGLCAVGIAWVAWPDDRPVPWHEHDEPREGGRSDVMRLSWSLHAGRGRVGSEALRRVQAIGRRRLAVHQLDPMEPSHAPAIERLIGGAALAVLRPSGAGLSSGRLPTMRSFVACLDALDTLAPPSAEVGRQVAGSWLLRDMLRRGRRTALTLLRRSTRRARGRHAE